MPSLRIRGQEASLIIVRGGIVEATLDNIHSFNSNLDSEILEAAYLGEKSKRFDDIFIGVSGDFEFHSHSEDWIIFAAALNDRQKRNTPDLVINISVSLQYPSLDNPVLFFPDCKFGQLAIGIPAREQYINHKIPWKCDDWDFQR